MLTPQEQGHAQEGISFNMSKYWNCLALKSEKLISQLGINMK